jgi:ribonuclease E
MQRILINAAQKEEIRVAMVDGQQLYDLDVEVPSREQKKSNVYKGKITRVEPSLEAAFVDYGAERHGFLPFKEIARGYYTEEARNSQGKVDIRTAIKEGQEVVVQIEKEERGNKGAALTTFISLAGRFLVLMPNNPRAGGVSRRIEGEDRDLIRDALSQLEVPNGMGLIVRTAGVGRNVEEMQWDLDYLLQLWDAFVVATESRPAPFLVYQESNVIIRALRDYFRDDVSEVLIDSPEVFETARQFIEQVMPNRIRKLKLYEDTVPLFNRFQIENQIESAYRREVSLPSGGSIVIDHTEALVSIDINSARATKGGDIEETATNTNLEAADEIARQLRLRDIGGLIVIDFIDMMAARNQREVENRLRDAVKLDRARVQYGRISRFGLMEMSRQRLKPSLGESTQIVCPRCSGQGTVRTVESLSLSLVRIIEEEALKDSTGRVDVQVPVDVATYLLNEKRAAIMAVEKQAGVMVVVIANPALETPQYKVSRVRKSEQEEGETLISYRQVEAEEHSHDPQQYREVPIQPELPAVQRVVPTKPVPAATEAKAKPVAKKPGLLSGLISLFVGGDSEKKTEEKPRSAKPAAKDRPAGRNTAAAGGAQGQRGSRGGRGRGGRGRTRARSEQGDKPQQQTSQPASQAAKPAKQPRPAVVAEQESLDKDATQGAQAAGSNSGQGSKSRRSRRGGGRRRRETSQASVTPETGTQNPDGGNVSSGENAGSTQSAPIRNDSAASVSQSVSSAPTAEAAPRTESAAPVESVQRNAPEPVSNQPQAAEHRPSQSPVEQKPVETRVEHKPAEPKAEARLENKPAAPKPVEASAESKPVAPKPADPRVESKPVESKPVEARVESKSDEPKPVETRVESRPAEPKQVETKVESKPTESTTPVDKSIAGD